MLKVLRFRIKSVYLVLFFCNLRKVFYTCNGNHLGHIGIFKDFVVLYFKYFLTHSKKTSILLSSHSWSPSISSVFMNVQDVLLLHFFWNWSVMFLTSTLASRSFVQVYFASLIQRQDLICESEVQLSSNPFCPWPPSHPSWVTSKVLVIGP